MGSDGHDAHGAGRQRWGLVNWIAPADRLEAKTLEIARELADGPTAVYGYTKAAVINGWEASPPVAVAIRVRR